jgi:hypothetical protein
MAYKQRFCCTKHRVYAGRKGLQASTSVDDSSTERDNADTTVATALAAAQAFTPVHIAETKTVAAIRVERKGADPVTWEVRVPSNSVAAATKIYQALHEHIGDLVTLANLLGRAAGEPQLVIRTRATKR